ncbi:hypothetical protein EYR41_009962 [Orbilia oligospora]|uniref:Uncharacterized protein n=1 Tax=Orbilia oligospora TaxID=2813651 RepID=A0A7C8PMX2_ORBOL|nr:hypothetical protein TWF751_005488 [Orbilia oligospora]TGJ63872.1 hypothetical protein EYR41_009962 [Orbilia oligospora]
MEMATRQSAKRAPRCNRLDEPVIRREIETLYSVLLWKVEDIQAEINMNHGLNATISQYRGRLSRWGCRQRLNNKEYPKIYRDLVAREKLGKNSEVSLGGVIKIPDRKIRKWVSRNITFTKRMIPGDHRVEDDNSLNSLGHPVLVQTPPSLDIIPLEMI